MRSMEKQFEELGENLHKKMHQARGEGFGIIKKTSLHHFSEASEQGYGQSTYLQLVIWKNSLLSLNGEIKSNTKEICDHTTSGIGSCCVICEDISSD